MTDISNWKEFALKIYALNSSVIQWSLMASVDESSGANSRVGFFPHTHTPTGFLIALSGDNSGWAEPVDAWGYVAPFSVVHHVSYFWMWSLLCCVLIFNPILSLSILSNSNLSDSIVCHPVRQLVHMHVFLPFCLVVASSHLRLPLLCPFSCVDGIFSRM